MSSCVAELDGILTSMLELKPPGVSSAKISSITSLCNANVQSESPLIQKVYAHFKKAPANKKLGVLYVVDSVTRQWLEQARKAGQTLGPDASGATFAAGVNHVTELLPALMQDIIAVAPEDQKVKIKKLIDIWERGNTFPAHMLNGFKERLNAPASNAVQSTTPTGTPPQGFAASVEAAKPAQDILSTLNNLRALAANSTPANSTIPLGNPPQASSSNVSFPQTAFQQNVPSVIPVTSMQNSMQPGVQAVNAPTPINNGVFSYPGGGVLPQNLFPSGQPSQPAPMPMMPQNNVAAVPDSLQQQLQILAAFRQQGIPQEQWAALLGAFMASAGTSAAANQVQPTNVGGGSGGRDDASRDRNGFEQYMRSPPGRYRGRSRSRSPGWERRRESPQPRRRDSPVYGEYGGNRNGDRGDYSRRGGATRGNDRGNGRGNAYRQRSPDRFRRSPSPRRTEHVLPAPGPKWVEYDHNLPKGHIKVYSRTLFVGGVTTNEEELRAIFASFGRVQTCIVNVDKRHAFVKMITREEAVRAKDGMEHFKHSEMQLRTRWGVGFGPRDCSDYQTGISVIPVDRLTDADRKWMLTAEYGGSGGKQIEEGIAVEEPDIEIGAGVSSKAISRRMQTDKSGSQGPRSTREPPVPTPSSGGSGRYRQSDRHENERENPNTVAVPPTVPSFGFQFPMMANGMQFQLPQLPPGFVLPGQSPAQPPPPGAT